MMATRYDADNTKERERMRGLVRQLDDEQLREFLKAHVAKWWLPDKVVFIPEVPKTSVGKFDKKVLRARLAEGAL